MFRLHLVIPVIILSLLLIGVIAMSFWAVRHPVAQERTQVTTTPITNQIKVGLRLSTTTFKYDEPVTAFVLVANTATEAYTYRFSSLCTDPQLLLDGQLLAIDKLCAQGLTAVTIQPGEQHDFTLIFRAVDPQVATITDNVTSYPMPVGNHLLQAVWGDRASEGVSIDVQQ